jgi:hypothetical protein
MRARLPTIRTWRADEPADASRKPARPRRRRRIASLSSVAVTKDHFADRPKQPADRTAVILGAPVRSHSDSWASIT